MGKTIVLGLGVSGRAAASFLQKLGKEVCGVDHNETFLKEHPEILALQKNGLVVYSENEKISLSLQDKMVVSPGIPSSHPLILEGKRLGIEIQGEIELGFSHFKNPIIGITGTNGKTTVTLLTTFVLNALGKKAKALGNIGTALLSHPIEDTTSILVVELSSFQLETIHSKALDHGVILNITPDHLDRYPSMEEYAKAKIHMQNCMKPNGRLWVFEEVYEEYGHLFQKTPFIYGYSKKADLNVENKKGIVGSWPSQIASSEPFRNHDGENILAAFSLCEAFGISWEAFIHAASLFKKPPHRIEYIGLKEGVAFYDDSKGTNLDAVIRAVHQVPGKIVLIAGGVDKGAAYTPWIQHFNNKVKYICAIGEAAFKIQHQLASAIPVKICENLETAVYDAVKVAKPGESVLLSPGCASFDMFRDYAHRGEEFQKIVGQLGALV